MKNKKYLFKTLYFLILFLQFTFVLSDNLKFEAATIETSNNGNLIKGFGGVEINDNVNLTLTGEEFQYNKLDMQLSVKVIFFDFIKFLLSLSLIKTLSLTVSCIFSLLY